jgi:hypothetical protein
MKKTRCALGPFFVGCAPTSAVRVRGACTCGELAACFLCGKKHRKVLRCQRCAADDARRAYRRRLVGLCGGCGRRPASSFWCEVCSRAWEREARARLRRAA